MSEAVLVTALFLVQGAGVAYYAAREDIHWELAWCSMLIVTGTFAAVRFA